MISECNPSYSQPFFVISLGKLKPSNATFNRNTTITDNYWQSLTADGDMNNMRQ